jgi:predicted alpha/beta-fold hydrolase
MKIHWQHKWMQITYGPTTVVLHGLQPESSDRAIIQLYHLTSDVSD